MDGRQITPKTPARCYAQDDKARLNLQAHGIPRNEIYEAKNDEPWEKIRMQDGEYLGIVGGLRAFGGAIKIKKALERFHGQGAAILDLETGQDSMTHGVAMFDTATGPHRMTEEDRKIMAEQRADAYREKHHMASKAEAHRIWHKVGPSIPAKIKATGWSKGALYAAFGRTGSPLGRRPKDFAAVERAALPPIKIKSPRSKHGFVYFMRINGRGHVKIGYATDIKSRLSGHGTSTPGKPVLVGSMHGTMTTEKRLHNKYGDLHVKGEWFKYTGALKAFVEALPEIDSDERT